MWRLYKHKMIQEMLAVASFEIKRRFQACLKLEFLAQRHPVFNRMLVLSMQLITVLALQIDWRL